METESAAIKIIPPPAPPDCPAREPLSWSPPPPPPDPRKICVNAASP
ncbi:MAG: hypothetical protein ACFFBV_15860 [Promethearchaeota archaeon]